MLESGSSSLKLSAIVVDRAMRGSFFCREGQGGCEHECLCRPLGLPSPSQSVPGGQNPTKALGLEVGGGNPEGPQSQVRVEAG